MINKHPIRPATAALRRASQGRRPQSKAATRATARTARSARASSSRKQHVSARPVSEPLPEARPALPVPTEPEATQFREEEFIVGLAALRRIVSLVLHGSSLCARTLASKLRGIKKSNAVIIARAFLKSAMPFLHQHSHQQSSERIHEHRQDQSVLGRPLQ